jgi:hypothetical protein
MVSQRLKILKAGIMAALFALPVGAILFVPVWFVLAFISRLTTGQVHRATFVFAGIAAVAFAAWVFRMAFGYFREAHRGSSERF